MKKQYDTSRITDELSKSVFFQKPDQKEQSAPKDQANNESNQSALDPSSGNQEARKQVTKETSLQENKQTRILVNKETVKQVSQETSKRAIYPKVTYQLNPTVTNLLQDTKIALQRQYNVKVSLAQIVEEAIQQACTDLQENKETSFLVSLFTRKQESK